MQHPVRMADSLASGAGEDFADMYMNWVLAGFAGDLAGLARNAWMDENIPGWLSHVTR